MAMSKVILKTMPGIERPAIAAIWPTLRGRSVILDVGATIGADAQQLVEIQTRNPQRWVKAMMIDELGLLPDDRTSLRSGLATLISFIVAGSVPLLIYLLGLLFPIPPAVAFPVSLALSGLALFGLGAAKVFVTQRSFVKSGLEMLLVGGLAAGVAYSVGALLKGIGG